MSFSYMHYRNANVFIWVLRFLLGGIFIFSGLAKLYPIEPFELLFVDAGIASWKFAPFISRIIVSAEIFVGLLLLFNISLKTFTLKAAFLLLIMFTVYLIYSLIRDGNANCGCFGSMIELTPVESLLKNIVLFGMVFLLMKKGRQFKNFPKVPNFRKVRLILPLILLVSCGLPFILNPVQVSVADNSFDKEFPYLLNLDGMSNHEDSLVGISNPDQQGQEAIDLSKDEQILAFMLINCPHCKNAAYKLVIADKKYDLPEIFFVFRSGNEEDIAAFMTKSKSDFPYILYNDNKFFEITGGIFPTILYMKKNYVYKRWTGKTLTYSEMEKFSDLH